MAAQPILVLLALSLSTWLGQPAEPTQNPQDESARSSEPRRGREGRGERRRDRWARFQSATPSERAQMRLDRMVEMSARTYDLDEMQKVMVRQELDRMQAERRVEMGADADEMDRLREQMMEFWSRPREAADGADGADGAGEDRRQRWRELRDDPEFRKLRDKMRVLEEKYPMNWEAAAQRVEALLPPEQAERGRLRREARQDRWRDRRGGDRNRGGPGRRDDREPRGGAAAAPAASAESAPAAAAGGQPVGSAPQAKTAAEQPVGERQSHAWEVYTRQFISQHELTDAQANAAHGILRDVQNRAAQIEAVLADRLAEAEKIRDSAARQKRLTELRAPIDQLFSELKLRLDGLLTAAQRQRAGV